MKRLFRIKYPKLVLLILFSIIAYKIFSNEYTKSIILNLGDLNYISTFIFGLLFTFGFTTPFAIGYFISIDPGNIFLSALIGGVGAVIGDLTIFKIIRFSFMDEFEKLEKTPLLKKSINLLNNNLPRKIKTYLLFTFAGLIIASPLPDEVGVTMLAGLSKIKSWEISIISFIGNTLGILVMLLL